MAYQVQVNLQLHKGNLHQLIGNARNAGIQGVHIWGETMLASAHCSDLLVVMNLPWTHHDHLRHCCRLYWRLSCLWHDLLQESSHSSPLVYGVHTPGRHPSSYLNKHQMSIWTAKRTSKTGESKAGRGGGRTGGEGMRVVISTLSSFINIPRKRLTKRWTCQSQIIPWEHWVTRPALPNPAYTETPKYFGDTTCQKVFQHTQ